MLKKYFTMTTLEKSVANQVSLPSEDRSMSGFKGGQGSILEK